MSEIICPNCQSRQPAEAVFCDNCGFGFAGEAAAPPRKPQPETADGPPPTPVFLTASPQAPVPGLQVCPACGASNLPEARYCDQCGSALGTPTKPHRAPAGKPAASAPANEGQAAALDRTVPEGPAAAHFVTGRLTLEPTGIRLEFPPGSLEVFVGREDPVSDIFPEIDLGPHGGEAAGVSRRHARFSLQDGQLVIEDLDSTNFTFVNRKRVMPGARQEVRNGDELRFGRITARYEGI